MDLRNRKQCTVSARQGVSIVKNCLQNLADKANLAEGDLTRIFGQARDESIYLEEENPYKGALHLFSCQITNYLGRQGHIKEDFRFVTRVIYALERSVQDNGFPGLLQSRSGLMRVVIAPDNEGVPERLQLAQCSDDEYQSLLRMRGGDTSGALDLIFSP